MTRLRILEEHGTLGCTHLCIRPSENIQSRTGHRDNGLRLHILARGSYLSQEESQESQGISQDEEDAVAKDETRYRIIFT